MTTSGWWASCTIRAAHASRPRSPGRRVLRGIGGSTAARRRGRLLGKARPAAPAWPARSFVRQDTANGDCANRRDTCTRGGRRFAGQEEVLRRRAAVLPPVREGMRRYQGELQRAAESADAGRHRKAADALATSTCGRQHRGGSLVRSSQRSRRSRRISRRRSSSRSRWRSSRRGRRRRSSSTSISSSGSSGRN